MSFLAPLFFIGLGAIVVPILVHLIQRERKRVIEFPSLMFIQKIPYQSVRRRRIRHWFLLLMRAAAIALFVAAFARPFFPGGVSALAAAGGNRAARNTAWAAPSSAAINETTTAHTYTWSCALNSRFGILYTFL